METKSKYISHHGIFISYKRSHKILAGRVYDFFKNKGLDPFLDENMMHQANDYWVRLESEILSAPYFLCILTKDGFSDLVSADYEKKPYYKEILTAVRSNRELMILRDKRVTYDMLKKLPQTINERIHSAHSEVLPEDNDSFAYRMETLFECIELDRLKGVINWRTFTQFNSNVLLLPKSELQDKTSTYENRFGAEFVQCVREKKEFTGQYIVKEINMACYSANMIFTSDRDMVDRKAYDQGTMSRIFANLLKDPDFNLRMVLNAPGSIAAKDAISFRKLGNSSHEEFPEAVFLSSFAKIHKLLEMEPYKTAYKKRRFSLTLSDCCLPFALFNVIYKKGWEELNHVKIDLYSINIDSSEERRSMLIFEKDNKADYDYFVRQIEYLRRDEFRKKSKEMIRENEERWLKEWDELEKIRGKD